MVDALRLIRGGQSQRSGADESDLSKAGVGIKPPGLVDEPESKPHNTHHRKHLSGHELSQKEDDREELAQQRRMLALQVAIRIGNAHRHSHHHSAHEEHERDSERLMLQRRMLNTFNIQLAVRQALIARLRTSGNQLAEEEDEESGVDDLASAFVKMLSKEDLKALEMVIPSDNDREDSRLSPEEVADLVMAVASGGPAKTQALDKLLAAGTASAPASPVAVSAARVDEAPGIERLDVEIDLAQSSGPANLATARAFARGAIISDETRFGGGFDLGMWLARECGIRRVA